MNTSEAPAVYEAHAATALICEEHRFLRSEFEALEADFGAGVELAEIAGHVRRFMRISAEHFLHEEWAMRVLQFPDLAVHGANHRRFMSEADDMLSKLCSSAWRRQERMAFTDAYRHWIEHHTAYDSRFTEYSLERIDARELIFDSGRERPSQSQKAIGERRFAAVLCADVAGFSRLVSDNEAETIAEWCSCWHEIVKPAIAAHDGRSLKNTGDGFVAEFAFPRQALCCALAIQTAVNQRRSTASLSRHLALRMGIHACHILPCGTDIFGHGVNIAARLQAEALPGTIYTRRARGARSVRLKRLVADIGFRRLKHIEEPLHVYVIEPRANPS